jgi:hypothetical protein
MQRIAGTKADIDIFVHGVDKAKATELMRQLLATVTERLKTKGLSYAWKCKSHTVTLVPAAAAADDEGAWSCSKCTFLHAAKRKRCEVCDTPYTPAEDVHGQWVPCPPIQIILYSIGSIEELLSGFDLDCCCVAYDGDKVWCAILHAALCVRWACACACAVNSSSRCLWVCTNLGVILALSTPFRRATT